MTAPADDQAVAKELVFKDLESELVSVAEVDLHGVTEDWTRFLFPSEAAGLFRMAARRRIEFIAGRVLAHQLMRHRGRPAAPVPRSTDRSPIWPPGLLGSITHTDDRCVVVMAEVEKVTAIGIDLEPLVPLEPSLWSTICTPAELWRLRLVPSQVPLGSSVRCIFACKEAFYKAWFPRTGRFLDHHDLEVMLEVDSASFDIILHPGRAEGAPPHGYGRGTLHFTSGKIGAAWIEPVSDQT